MIEEIKGTKMQMKTGFEYKPCKEKMVYCGYKLIKLLGEGSFGKVYLGTVVINYISRQIFRRKASSYKTSIVESFS